MVEGIEVNYLVHTSLSIAEKKKPAFLFEWLENPKRQFVSAAPLIVSLAQKKVWPLTFRRTVKPVHSIISPPLLRRSERKNIYRTNYNSLRFIVLPVLHMPWQLSKKCVKFALLKKWGMFQITLTLSQTRQTPQCSQTFTNRCDHFH